MQLHAGIVAAAVLNSAMTRKEGSKPIDPIDFVPDYKKRLEQERVQTLEQQIAILSAVMGCGPKSVH